MAITLESFGWRAQIIPSLGGAMTSLQFDGMPVLRDGAAGTGDVLDCASFPLIPFANRIGHGMLRFGSRVVQLEREPLAWPHAHHGHGWRAEWCVTQITQDRLTLVYDHPGPNDLGNRGWPWPYRAEQRFFVHPGGIQIDMAVVNCHPHSVMPCGTGIHPYFSRSPSSAIAITATKMWATHGDGLARALEATDLFASGKPVPVDALEGIDNFFECTTPVTVFGGGHPVSLRGSAMAGVHIYVPAGADYFCVEPVSHAPDAFGRGDYERGDVIAPGATIHWRWQIDSASG